MPGVFGTYEELSKSEGCSMAYTPGPSGEKLSMSGGVRELLHVNGRDIIKVWNGSFPVQVEVRHNSLGITLIIRPETGMIECPAGGSGYSYKGNDCSVELHAYPKGHEKSNEREDS